MKRVLANTAEQVHAYRANITLALLCATALCVMWYAVNLYSLVSRTIALRQTEKSIASVSSQVSDLDSQYLKLTSSVTPDELANYGLSEGKVAVYIKRNQSTASLLPTLAQSGHEL